MKIETIKSGAPRPLANYNECFKVGPWVFAAGQIASDYKTGVAPEARRNPAFPYYGSDIKLQTHYVLGNLKKTELLAKPWHESEVPALLAYVGY
jgi:enamine deaminase RidA (YjgF/YER057c/UK114 family)